MTVPSIHLELQSDNSRRAWHRCCQTCALIAAGFIVAIAAILLISFLRDLRTNPLSDTQLATLKSRLSAAPDDAALKEQIRQADLAIRKLYFDRRAFFVRGGWLLLGGSLVLVISLKLSATLGHQPYIPAPGSSRPSPLLISALSRRAILVGTFAIAGILIAMAAMPRPVALLSSAAPVRDQTPTIPPRTPAVDSLLQWAGFRGTLGTAIAPPADYPTTWDGPSGKSILWKAPLPLEGHNSPIVWGNRLFLSAATAQQRQVLCFNASSGVLEWAFPFPMAGPEPRVSEGTGLCPATLAADASHLYATFPTGEVLCLDHTGKKLWSKSLGTPANNYGHASSPRAWEGRLFIQFDQGGKPEQNLSSLTCFDGNDGHILWQTKRASSVTWSTPAFVKSAQGIQILCSGSPWFCGYDLATGRELWRAKKLSGDVAPSPTFGGGLAIACQESADLLAVRIDGSGDVTSTHIAWKYADDLPDISSPLASDQLLWLSTTGGTFTCIDLKTGQQVYQQSLDTEMTASPALAGGRVYLLDNKGVTYVVDAGRAYKELAKNNLGEEAEGSPAFANGHIYIRGKQNLYCIGAKP